MDRVKKNNSTQKNLPRGIFFSNARFNSLVSAFWVRFLAFFECGKAIVPAYIAVYLYNLRKKRERSTKICFSVIKFCFKLKEL